MIARRSLLSGTTALAAVAALSIEHAQAANGTIPGAIRWDAWYGGGSGSEPTVNQQVANSLGPQRWQSRAPWFATPPSAFSNAINGNAQAVMDAEIGYAASAGLKYWAYVWYGQETPASQLQNAWALHQSSSVKANMNWCLMLQFSRMGPASFWNANIAAYVSYFQQANYQTVTVAAAVRPLVYVYIDDLTHLTTDWGASWANVQTAFNALRTATTGAGLATPYIVLLNGTPANAASYVTQTSADAISNYTGGVVAGVAMPWATYETGVEAFWASMGATGTPIVPIAQTGWDRRPRLQTPPSFGGAGQRAWFGANVYIVPPTGAQLTTHLQAAVSYVVANPTQCPSKAILIYSWDECDEGGSAIIPTYGTGSGPDTGRITALQGVTW
jgi:hypothetical protein